MCLFAACLFVGLVFVCLYRSSVRSDPRASRCALTPSNVPGVEPQTLDEWKLLIRLSQQRRGAAESQQLSNVNGSSWSNGSADCEGKISPESLTLALARTAGPERALKVLEECGVQPVFSAHSELVCELLRVAEKRQRWVSLSGAQQ